MVLQSLVIALLLLDILTISSAICCGLEHQNEIRLDIVEIDMDEDTQQELYLTSGESSIDSSSDSSSDEEQSVSRKPPPEERSIVSSSSLHVLSEMKKTSVLLALIEDKEEKEPEKEKSKGKTIFFNRQPSFKKDKQQPDDKVYKEEPPPALENIPIKVYKEEPPLALEDIPNKVYKEEPPLALEDTPIKVYKEEPSPALEDTPIKVYKEEPPLALKDIPNKVYKEEPPLALEDIPNKVYKEEPPPALEDTPIIVDNTNINDKPAYYRSNESSDSNESLTPHHDIGDSDIVPLNTQEFIEETVPKDIRMRIASTLDVMIDLIDKDDSKETDTPGVHPVFPFFQLPKVSTSFKNGINLGYIMISLYLLPVLPKTCGRDIWFLIKFLISLILLILSLIDARYTNDWVFPVVSISVAVVMVLFTYVDGCLFYLHQLKKCLQSKRNIGKSSCVSFYSQWYEIIRSIKAELLMYPLIVFCLFELFYIGTIDIKNNIIVLVILIVSVIYLVLTVYIVRPIMVIVTIFRIRKISFTNNRRSYTLLFVRFLIHVIGQAIAHVLVLVAIGISLWEEGKTRNNWDEVSPFLWVVIVTGWFIPLTGTLSFITINYYWIQQISLEVFIDVIAYCERPEFTNAIFANRMEPDQFIQHVSYHSVRQETIKRQGRASLMAKIYSPFNVPFIVIYGIIFNAVFIGFVTSLLYDSFNDHSVIVIVVSIITTLIITLVNIQFLFTFNVWLLVAIVIGPPLLLIWTVKNIKRTFTKKGEGYTTIN